MPEASGKLLPRNLAALRVGADPGAGDVVASANPAATLLQSGVGNCFPGLEFDLRNLERRFFPHLVVETDFTTLQVSAVDRDGVSAALAAGTVTAETATAYREIADSIGSPGHRWAIARLAGDFGLLGKLDFAVNTLDGSSMGPGRRPSDAWTAIRLLKEGAPVTLTLTGPTGQSLVITGPRMRYLDPNGALSTIFEVGELSQSLCSPWTHDFRDCGCYYWAANHPDIALPPAPPSGEVAPAQNLATPWLRADRSGSPPVADGAGGADEIRYAAINRAWQDLNVVLERRERVTPYVEQPLAAQPLPDVHSLQAHLRYAAGVELAVMQEYLVAAWSLRLSAGTPEPLRGDLRAAFFALREVAIGEMGHLRSVNQALLALAGPGPFEPALRVAAQVPIGPGLSRPLSFRPLTPDVMAQFVQIEARSTAVDSLYEPILATLEDISARADVIQPIRTIMAEGEEHWQTFLFIQEWLSRHAPADYLRATTPAAPTLPAHLAMQTRYRALLESLHRGYALGVHDGFNDINTARLAMSGAGGMEGALEAVASTGALPRFDPVADPRFAALPPPP